MTATTMRCWFEDHRWMTVGIFRTGKHQRCRECGQQRTVWVHPSDANQGTGDRDG